MIFACQACGATLQKSDIDFKTGVACCGQCEAVMSFAEEMGLNQATPTPSQPVQETAPAPRPEVAKPKRLRIEEDLRGVRIIRPWFDGSIIFLTVFCLFWDGFLVVWYTAGTSDSGGLKILTLLFPIFHVVVGVSLTYYTICGYVNRTTLGVDETQLSIRNGPLPWRGNQTLLNSEIKQIYCTRKLGQSDDDDTYFYSLNALLKNGEEKALLTNILDHDMALYMEQQLEKRLGIPDERVPGEAP